MKFEFHFGYDMTFDDMAGVVQHAVNRDASVFCDTSGMGKAFVVDFGKRYKVPITALSKTEKG